MFKWTNGRSIVTEAEKDAGARLYTIWNRLKVVWFDSRVLEVSDETKRWVLRVVGVEYRRTHFWFPPPHTAEGLNVALKKVQDAAGGVHSEKGKEPADAPLYTNIWEHLSCTRYPDGTARQTSTIIIVAGDAGWRGCLSDKDNGRVMWKTGDTLESLLNAIETALNEDDPRDWRRASEPPKKRR